MHTLRLPSDLPTRTAAACTLVLCMVVAAGHARPAMAQAQVAPKEVAESFLKLLTAKLVDVKTIVGPITAEPPLFFRVRLYVSATVSGQSWAGVDYRLFRQARSQESRDTQRIELASPRGLFRDRLNELLRDPLSATLAPDEAGVRVVDVWCRHSGGAGGHTPLMAKVWFNDQHPDPAAAGEKQSVTGRLCHDDNPQVVECLRALDAQPLLEQLSQEDMQALSADPAFVPELTKAIEIYRADIAAFKATPVDPSPKKMLMPGGVALELRGTQDLPATQSDFDDTESRILESGDEFIGLKQAAPTGKASITIDLPRGTDWGGGAVWAPAIVSDETATLEVEASGDGLAWTPLYKLDATARSDKRQHVLPASSLKGASIMIRARLTSQANAAADRGNGLRYLVAAPPVLSHYEIERKADLLRVVPREPLFGACPYQLRIVLQPKVLAPHEVVDMVRVGMQEADFYVPCQLDEDACRGIGTYAGVIRFWSLPDWKDTRAEWQKQMVSGNGWFIFPTIEELSVDVVTAVAAGKKSLSFPNVRNPSCELLNALATCSGELAFDGIETLSTEQSLALIRYQGPKLSLSRLHAVHLSTPPQESPSNPESPSRWRSFLRAVVDAPGICTLSGLTELDEAAARELAAGRKQLILDDVKNLSEPVAKALARMEKGLSLNGVIAIKEAEAAALLSFGGEYLSVTGLREVECGIDDLPTADGRRWQSLSSLLEPTARAAADAERHAYLDELNEMSRARVRLGKSTEDDSKSDLANLPTDIQELKRFVADMRSRHDDLPPSSKVWIGVTGEPLDALVKMPGVFTLRRRVGGLRLGTGTFDAKLAQKLSQKLSQGQKHLNLDCLSDLDLTPEIAAILATSRNVVSLDGIQSMTKEVAAALAGYQGPLLSLAGVEELEDGAEPLLEPLVRDGRVSLPKKDMFNIAELRKFVEEKRRAKKFQGDESDDADETDEQKKTFDSFWDRSRVRLWAGKGRTNRGQMKVVLLLPDKVEFDDGNNKVMVDRNNLLEASKSRLDKLAEDATAVVAMRKDSLLSDALGRVEAVRPLEPESADNAKARAAAD